jgi:cation transport protein ChaC
MGAEDIPRGITVQPRAPRPDSPALPLAPDGTLWVFGYGSLIWKPGFAHDGRFPARLRGYHRSFCLWSHRYRGTPERPGLVLGLDRGGACRGVVFRVPGAAAAEVLAYLDARELPDGAEVVYHRRTLHVDVARPAGLTGVPSRVPAIAYVANRACRLYVPSLDAPAAAATIAASHGQMGANREYLLNTIAHLADIGVRDAGLLRIAALMPAE